MTPSVNRLELPALNGDRSPTASPLGPRVELVEHVHVRLSVTLGAAELPIGKLFELASGDVLELDRDVDAPVDVQLNGRVVARGQLVAAGDHFGVRITELCGS